MSNDSDSSKVFGEVPYDDDPRLSPALKAGVRKPHLAFLVGPNQWIPIVVGCTIALITDRSKINGIAPYVVTKMSWKPGRECIEMVAVGKSGTERRILKLGSRYMGHHTMSTDEQTDVVDALTGTKEPTKPE